MKGLKFKEMIAIFLIVLFSYTSASKLLNHGQFVYQMKISPLKLVSSSANFLGIIVPFIEILIVIYLSSGILLNKYLSKAIAVSVLLISIFEVYIIGMLLSGMDLPCSCGGIISQMSWKAHLVFNGLFIITGIISLTSYRPFLKSRQISQ